MTEYTVYSVVLNLFYLALTLGMIRVMLYWFDRSLGIRFRDVWTRMAEDPRALAMYHGLRLVFVGIIAAAFIL